MTQLEQQLDPERVRRALEGDREAARELTDALIPTVHARVARALMRRRAQARGRDVRQEIEDMVQEVFAALFRDDGRMLRKWEPDRGLSLKNFVGLVAEQRVAALLRSGRRSPWTEDPSEADEMERARSQAAPTGAVDVERQVASRQLLERLVDGLQASLSPLGLQVFELLFVEQREVDEVCELTGMQPGTVHTWRSRLRKRAKELAAELERAAGGEA